jgi:hypothetical protein
MTDSPTPTTPRNCLAAPDGTRRSGLWGPPLFPFGGHRPTSTIQDRGAARAEESII